jgi:hypothetical protein
VELGDVGAAAAHLFHREVTVSLAGPVETAAAVRTT